MKVNGPNGRPYTRLDSIKQAIMLFVHSKLSINPDHRFAFSALSKSTYWLRKEFSSEVDASLSALRGLSVDSSASQADLTQLFKVATHEAKKSCAQNRIFRVILIYCRSSMPPQSQLPSTLKLFTLDDDKPGPHNCPQVVYDTLLLCHPQQRCIQDELDLPKSLVKKFPAADALQGNDNVVVSSK
ncbi:uncharacterized protein LOC125211605 isoform X2 [Salvia hispanica]|uniref:uncharacterized protein LOC125211605 isoform X2 n=1 Tax=Salvia hispanica TaxID=49212 RepID=UPI0020095D6C|nr:uncharacterized protein LOC125211605 isoform X2 [Salvia hispanica]